MAWNPCNTVPISAKLDLLKLHTKQATQLTFVQLSAAAFAPAQNETLDKKGCGNRQGKKEAVQLSALRFR